MSTTNKILFLIVLIVSTVFVVTIFHYNTKMKEYEIKISAILKPAVVTNPSVTTTTKKSVRIPLSKWTTVYFDNPDLLEQITEKNLVIDSLYAELENTQTVTITGGTTSTPVIPQIPIPQTPAVKSKRYLCEVIAYPDNYTCAVGVQPLKALDFYGILGYNKVSGTGIGGLYRF